MRPDPIGIIVLAAGGSARMGRPKQLLPIGVRTLVRLAAEAAVNCDAGPVVVVTGAGHAEVERELATLPVRLILNSSWERGMGTSIRAGVEAILRTTPDVNGVLITLCDQPQVSDETLRRVIAAHREAGAGLCAAAFDDSVGPPVLMSRQYFAELLALPDADGAKRVLLAHPDDVCRVPCPEAGLDIDTPADYRRLGGEGG